MLCIRLPPATGKWKKLKLADRVKALVEAGKITVDCGGYLGPVWIAGNETVHPETLNPDDEELLTELFGTVNEIVEPTIGKTKDRAALLQKLPEEKRRKLEAKAAAGEAEGLDGASAEAEAGSHERRDDSGGEGGGA